MIVRRFPFYSIAPFPLTKKETRKKTTIFCGLFAVLKPFFSTSCVWILKIVLLFSNETFLTYLDLNFGSRPRRCLGLFSFLKEILADFNREVNHLTHG